MKISILGCGGWGTALAMLAESCGHNTVLWGKFPEEVAKLDKTRQTPLLPGIVVPQNITLTSNLRDTLGSRIYIIATPSFAVKETSGLLCDAAQEDAIIVSVAKGFCKETLARFSCLIKEQLPQNSVVVLSGPSHAEEVARQLPTSVVAAGECAPAQVVQDALSNDFFRIYTNEDVVGVETGAALKNVIAVAAGIIDGLGLGDNTIAALITRGIHEISRLGKAMGGEILTFAGLSGIGDLIVTCTSAHSRNRQFGKLLGQGMSVPAARERVGSVVEGYFAADSAKQLAAQYGVDMPIIDECYKILYDNMSAREALAHLMGRELKEES